MRKRKPLKSGFRRETDTAMILTDFHVHTTFCDGKSTAREMAQAAYERGFVSLGFSSHAPQTFDPAHCIDPLQEDVYKAEIRTIQQEYAGRIAVYLGMERDMLSCSDPQSLDYFIASVHYFTAPDGRRIGVARGYMTEPYPAAFLLSAWKEWGGEAIINSDCHYAPLIDGAILRQKNSFCRWAMIISCA